MLKRINGSDINFMNESGLKSCQTVIHYFPILIFNILQVLTQKNAGIFRGKVSCPSVETCKVFVPSDIPKKT